jgi:hypothetical protein
MPHHFGRFQRAAMAQVETFGAALHQTVQFVGDRFRIVFERRPDCVAREREAADQNA